VSVAGEYALSATPAISVLSRAKNHSEVVDTWFWSDEVPMLSGMSSCAMRAFVYNGLRTILGSIVVGSRK
jgi:hypothetical protein